jgi:hypothetical protein
MRFWEFVIESAKGHLHPEQKATLPRVHKFGRNDDRFYKFKRATLAAACSNGETMPHHDPTQESWGAQANLAVPYTDLEHRMLKHAYKSIGVDSEDTVKSPGHEPEEVNKKSPVNGFKGYPR